MAKQKISAQRKYEIGTLFDYKLQDVMLPPTLDPVIYPQMNLNTAKAWFQVLSIIQETTSDDIEAGIVSYTFAPIDALLGILAYIVALAADVTVLLAVLANIIALILTHIAVLLAVLPRIRLLPVVALRILAAIGS